MKSIFEHLLNFPILRKYSNTWYNKLGVKMLNGGGKIYPDVKIKGNYSNIVLHANSEINSYCFLLAKEKIEIGENSTLAYGTSILTSANPNGPLNKLSSIYPKMTAPVIIGDNVWVGANSTILPGVTIGDMAVVAAGSVVIRDVPSGVLVAGNPAVMKKNLV